MSPKGRIQLTLSALGLRGVDTDRVRTPRRDELMHAIRTLTAGTTVAEALESGIGADGSVEVPLSEWSEAELESWLKKQVDLPTSTDPDDPAL